MKKKLTVGTLLLTSLLVLGFVTTSASNAATTTKAPFYYGAWLPYWRGQVGAQNISQNLDNLQEISPFSYEVGAGGTLIDDLNIGNGSWAPWFGAVQELGIKIIPTIADFNGNAIYNMLSVAKTRQAMEDRIAALVKAQSFNGIDIDFEAMTEATRPYYSLFIQGLAIRLHPAGKKLTCTVIARTPPAELYTVITPDDLVYPENYSVLNQYCDEVRVMAYDQETIDIKLNAAKGNGHLYTPTTDPDWVSSVLTETLRYISPKKVMLGIPTYGYEYQVSWAQGITQYERVRAFDYLQAMDRADSLGLTPVRNSADELSFMYASTTYINVPASLVTTVYSAIKPVELGIQDPNAPTTFYVTFPDSVSIANEIAVAKKFGIRGAMLFKADGDIDPATWDYMK